GGYMEGQPLEESDVIQLADLESRETLLSMMAGAMKGSLSKAAATFQAQSKKLFASQKRCAKSKTKPPNFRHRVCRKPQHKTFTAKEPRPWQNCPLKNCWMPSKSCPC